MAMKRKLQRAKHHRIILAFVLLNVFPPGLLMASGWRDLLVKKRPDQYFKIQVVDRQTGRGVPLVQLRTTSNLRQYTDSNGIIAFHEPGLMDREVFFFVESHGYAFPKDHA